MDAPADNGVTKLVQRHAIGYPSILYTVSNYSSAANAADNAVILRPPQRVEGSSHFVLHRTGIGARIPRRASLARNDSIGGAIHLY